MYPSTNSLPQPLQSGEDLADLDALVAGGDIKETPFNVFIGHNLGHRVFTMSVPFRQFHEISDVANDREAGPVAQRPLDKAHATNLAKYMLRGLVVAAINRRKIKDENIEIPGGFEVILHNMGNQPYFSLQPIVCNIRNVPFGGTGQGGIRGIRLETKNDETAAFRVFLAERHVLWVVDGQHRRAGADMVMDFLGQVRQSGKYPAKTPVLYPDKGQEVAPEEMLVWNEAYEATRGYATITVEAHLGLDVDQERQLFHDLNRLGKKVNPSQALQFDSSNAITMFIKQNLIEAGLIRVTEKDIKNWEDDKGELVLKDIVAVTAIAFMNKSSVSGATPALVQPRENEIFKVWEAISNIEGFGEERARTNTVAAQPVVLKAISKIVYDLLYSNRKPENGEALFDKFLSELLNIDFSHNNPVWRYYELTDAERTHERIAELAEFLPSSDDGANRDIGSFQGGYMRFGAKHNDIFPIIADMIRWQIGLPTRHEVSGDSILNSPENQKVFSEIAKHAS